MFSQDNSLLSNFSKSDNFNIFNSVDKKNTKNCKENLQKSEKIERIRNKINGINNLKDLGAARKSHKFSRSEENSPLVLKNSFNQENKLGQSSLLKCEKKIENTIEELENCWNSLKKSHRFGRESESPCVEKEEKKSFLSRNNKTEKKTSYLPIQNNFIRKVVPHSKINLTGFCNGLEKKTENDSFEEDSSINQKIKIEGKVKNIQNILKTTKEKIHLKNIFDKYSNVHTKNSQKSKINKILNEIDPNSSVNTTKTKIFNTTTDNFSESSDYKLKRTNTESRQLLEERAKKTKKIINELSIPKKRTETLRNSSTKKLTEKKKSRNSIIDEKLQLSQKKKNEYLLVKKNSANENDKISNVLSPISINVMSARNKNTINTIKNHQRKPSANSENCLKNQKSYLKYIFNS